MLDLLRRVHARESPAFAPLKRLSVPDLTVEATPTAEQNWCCGGGADAFLIHHAESH
jgi:hypothetical protein